MATKDKFTEERIAQIEKINAKKKARLKRKRIASKKKRLEVANAKRIST